MHYRLCAWLKNCECCNLDWVLTHDAISFARNMFMHSHALFFFFFSIPRHLFYYISFLLLSLVVSLIWHLRSLFLEEPDISSWFYDSNPKRILMGTSVTRWFTQNVMSLFFIFKTLLYPVCLALEVGNLYVRNPRGVLACLYRSSTPTYMLLIPLFLSLLRYLEEHVS